MNTSTRQVPDNQHVISIHAVQRYLERVLKVTLDKDGYISKEQIDHVRALIHTELIERYPLAYQTGDGDFLFKEEGFIICMVNNTITTVKVLNTDQNKKFKGGITKSGRKTKKTGKVTLARKANHRGNYHEK